jgi:ketosteroid isomerase-like protein
LTWPIGWNHDRPNGREERSAPNREDLMTNDEKKRIVTAYLEASAARDLERMAALLTDDFTLWMVPSAREMGMPSPLVGRETFFEFVAGLSQRPDMWKVRETRPAQFLFGEDDSVAVRLRSIGDFASGYTYDNEYVFIYKLADGRICEMREFTDVAYINILRERAGVSA